MVWIFGHRPEIQGHNRALIVAFATGCEVPAGFEGKQLTECSHPGMVSVLTDELIQKAKEIYQGLTVIELLIAIAIIGILSAIAVPSFISYRYNSKVDSAISDIHFIETAIENYIADEGELPDNLSEIDLDHMTDPWGNPYQYLRIDGGTTPGIEGERRRDKNANPVNSDYDLYSMGQDGQTAAQFTAQEARDDIVRANDGDYLGLAGEH